MAAELVTEPQKLDDKRISKHRRRKQPAFVKPAPGLEVASWEQVALSDVNLEDQTFQYRLSANVGEIRRSLHTDGQEEPIDLLGPSKPYRIIDGFRRCAAARDLGWPTIKAFVHKSLKEEAAFRLAFTKNVVRRNLAPMEKAHALWVAQKRGFKKNELQTAFGISEKQVVRYLELLTFPAAVQRCLDGKLITMAHAKVLADFHVDDVSRWRKRVEDDGLDAKQLKKLLSKETGRRIPGRKKLYLRATKDGLRVYPFAVNGDTPRGEREKIAKLLKEALEYLERD
jgi:ParB/RepB/Spo0J family partition protein